VKNYLSFQQITFQEVNIFEKPEFIPDFKCLVGEITAPVFYMNEKIFTGEHIYRISNKT
jgi:hypothetical protein